MTKISIGSSQINKNSFTRLSTLTVSQMIYFYYSTHNFLTNLLDLKSNSSKSNAPLATEQSRSVRIRDAITSKLKNYYTLNENKQEHIAIASPINAKKNSLKHRLVNQVADRNNLTSTCSSNSYRRS